MTFHSMFFVFSRDEWRNDYVVCERSVNRRKYRACGAMTFFFFEIILQIAKSVEFAVR